MKNTQISNFMAIYSVEAELHAGKWTDMTKAIAAFVMSVNMPKNERKW
jgi:hypothetical protein